MGLIDSKIQKALKPATDKIEEMILSAQVENKKLMLEKVDEMVKTIDEIVEKKVEAALKMRNLDSEQLLGNTSKDDR